MEEKMITVPYGDFIDGVKALTDLESIRAMITNGREYASDAVMAVLGLEKKECQNI